MARVFLLDIPDQRMASIARTLLRAHCCIVGLCLIYGILQVIQFCVYEDLNADAAEDGASSGNQGTMVRGGIAIALNMALPFICPIGGFFIIRAGLKTNNSSLMQVITFSDGCCSCCMLCGVSSGIVVTIGYVTSKQWAEELDCQKEAAYYGMTVEECEPLRQHVINSTPCLAAIAIIGIILMFVAFVMCVIGTVKSSQAHAALIQCQLFCINAGAPGQMPNTQPGTIMVVGRVEGQPNVVPMGQPIAGGPVTVQS